MLSSVLRSERAIQVNIAIMRAFVRLRAEGQVSANWLQHLTGSPLASYARGTQRAGSIVLVSLQEALVRRALRLNGTARYYRGWICSNNSSFPTFI